MEVIRLTILTVQMYSCHKVGVCTSTMLFLNNIFYFMGDLGPLFIVLALTGSCLVVGTEGDASCCHAC
jgi:hypothetical protein